MAASQNQLNPIYLNNKSIELLTEAAASDAKHDFDTFFLKIFSSIRDGNKFKEIGTSILLDKLPTPADEHPTLHKMLDDSGKAILHGSTTTNTRWNDALFPEGGDFTFTSEKFALNPVLNPPDGTKTNEYTLITKKFNAPGFNAVELFDFLDTNFGNQKKLYVQQDAGSISYNDKFQAVTNGPSGGTPYLFYYLNSREGQNDAAGKTTGDSPVVTDTASKKVKVQILQETLVEAIEEGRAVQKERQIIYTSLPNSSLGRNAPYTNNFNSIYNIEVSPIIYEEVKTVLKKVKKTARVCLYFRDDKNQVIGSTNKGKRENAVGTLTSILTTFLNKLLKKQKETAPYFQALQQKRGGDWFQCLATFDKQRFGLTDKDTILLFTHDLICLAYAIANGVNVLFSFSKSGDDKRIMLFKNIKTNTTKGLLSYLDDIENLNKAVIDRKVNIDTKLFLYARSRKTLVDALKTKIDTELDSFSGKLDRMSDPANVHKTVRELVRDLLKKYFEYAFFTNMFPSEQSFIAPYYNVTFPEGGGDPVVSTTESYDNVVRNFKAHNDYILNLLKGIIFEAVAPDGYETIFENIKKTDRAEYKKRNDFYKYVENKEERKKLDSIDADFTPRPEEIKNELNQKIKELEGLVGTLYTLEKRLESYTIEVSGILSIDITRLAKVTKIKSKDVDAISLFLDNFNPIPVNLKVNAAGIVEKTFRPKNRLSIFTNLTGGRNKTEIEEHNEKSEVDYSVFNYFIGNQLPKPMKDTFVEKLVAIKEKMDVILHGVPGNGATLRKHNDLKATIVLYEYFINEAKFHLDENTDWNYEMGLTTDILSKIHLLYKKEASPGGVFEGGGNKEKKIDVMVGGDIELSEEDYKKITKFLLETFPTIFPDDSSLNSDFLENLDEELSSGNMKKVLKKHLPILVRAGTFETTEVNDEEYDTIKAGYIELFNTEGVGAFDLIKNERNKINVEKIGEFILNPDELEKIIKTTAIAKIAADEANRIATKAVEDATADVEAAETLLAEARAMVLPGNAEMEAAATLANTLKEEAEAAKNVAVSKKRELDTALNTVTTKADEVVQAMPAASASGAPPTPADIDAAKAAKETANLPDTKTAAKLVSTKAKEVVEQAELVAKKAANVNLAKSKINMLINKNRFFSLFFPSAAAAAVAAPSGNGSRGVAPVEDGSSPPASAGAGTPEIPTAFETEMNDIYDNYIKEQGIITEKAIKDTKDENVLLSTPEAMYLDILMRYRELYGSKFTGAEIAILDKPDEDYNKKIATFKSFLTRTYPVAGGEEAALKAAAAAATAVGAAGTAEAKLEAAKGSLAGGAREPFTINNVNVPFLGWTTLYFYGLSLLQELEDTKHVSEGFDYPYLARQTQFFLSMEQSMYTHALPKQRGGGGQGSPNQSSGSTVMTLSSNTNAFSRVAIERKYNSSLKQRADDISQIMKIYAIGAQCDLFLTNILPRLQFIQSAEAQALKQSIFDAMGIGESYGWIAYFSGIQNDFFFGQSMDSSLDSEVDFTNPFLQRFLQTTLETLKSSPPYDFTDEAKYAAQAKIRQSLDKMIDFLNNTEHDLVKQMYQEILINRAEEKKKTAQATRKIQTINTFNNQRKNKNSLTNEINKIMNYTYAHFCDLQFLIANGLVKEEGKRLGTGPLTTEFDTQRHSAILQSIPNGLQRFKEMEPKLQANPQLKQKYIQRIKNLNTYRQANNREKYNRAFKALQSFLENPDNPGLLTGGTRKRKALRLKSRRRTHRKR